MPLDSHKSSRIHRKCFRIPPEILTFKTKAFIMTPNSLKFI